MNNTVFGKIMEKVRNHRLLPDGKNKKVIGLMKHELGRKIIEFAGLKAKTLSYLTDNNDENKKAKRTKQCVIK